jgi:hypothetical protein
MPREQAPQATEIQKTQPVPEEKSTLSRDSTPVVSQGSLSHTARRKETIDRLEHWLKNIRKEKP